MLVEMLTRTAVLLFALFGLSATLQFVSNHECIGEEKECPECACALGRLAHGGSLVQERTTCRLMD